MKMQTVGPQPTSPKEFAEDMKAAEAELGEEADLALVYLPGDRPPQPYLDALAATLNVPVVGASTGGAGFTERGYSSSGSVGAVLASRCVSSVLIENIDVATDEKINSALNHMAMGQGRYASLVVLADGLTLDGDALVTSIRQHLPPHVRVFGGTAGDHWRFEKTFVFYGQRACSNAAVLVALNPRNRVAVQALHGFRSAPDARDLVITSIEGNILRTLNDEPAASVYEGELRRLGYWDGSTPLASAAALHELGAPSPFGEKLVIRAPVAFRPDGAVQLAGGLPLGATVRVVETSPDNLIEAAATLRRTNESELGGTTVGSLVFDCAARLKLLGPRYPEQIDALLGDGSNPVLGFACYGEIAKSGATLAGFHNTTAVLASWS